MVDPARRRRQQGSGNRHEACRLAAAPWLVGAVREAVRQPLEHSWLEFPRLVALREMFQLPDPRQLANDWASASAYRFDAADIAAAHTALASLPLARRLQRFGLLKSLAIWRDGE